MRSTQDNELAVDEVRISLSPESPEEPGLADASRPKPYRKRRAFGIIFQLLVIAYAVSVLVITLQRYTKAEGHPGIASFFIACTAIFYIVFYNALSIEQAFKQWLKTHYPALERLSIAVALVLATFPIGALYVMRSGGAQLSPPAVSQRMPTTAATSISSSPKIEALKVPTAGTVPGVTNPIFVLRDVRYESGANSTTITIDIDEKAKYEINRLANPDRIYLDFQRVKLDGRIWGKTFQVADSLLRAIRIAEHGGNVTRLTLETRRFSDYFVSTVGQSRKLQLELRDAVRADMTY